MCVMFFIWIVFVSSVNCLVAHGSVSWYPYHYVQHASRRFEQKTDRFWEYNEKTNRWVEVELPYDLVSCVDGNCTKIGLISRSAKNSDRDRDKQQESYRESKATGDGVETTGIYDMVLPLRKRISLTRMAESSIWVTGESGSIYERFWNGVQWVTAPHDLPILAGPAVSVFTVNQTILALSEAGYLYQMQLTENSQPIWVEFPPTVGLSSSKEKEQNTAIQIKSGVVSEDGLKVYFCTKNGLLLELCEVEPPRWANHGRPPGANVAEIADAANVRQDVVFTISSIGELYEFDRSSKPSWKKHIAREGSPDDTILSLSRACTVHGFYGDNSESLFLLSKHGDLIERRVHQHKWKWIVHGSPKDHNLTSITLVQHDDSNEKYSLFFTTTTGNVLEYRIPKHSEMADSQIHERWINHMHPVHCKAARGISGVQIQVGRILFLLDDGRLAELHQPGLGGENSGPSQVNVRRKPSSKYVWTILDAPETEGWNAEYCTEERGPANCMTGIKDEPDDLGATRPVTWRRKASQTQQEYLIPGTSDNIPMEEHNFPDDWINTNFRLRVMYEARSFFLITDGGLTFEYLYAESVWFWLRHDHSTAMKGALGNYNGTLFAVDMYGSLFMRERSNNALKWINCTAMKKGRQVIGGPPWDGIPGRDVAFTVDNALFLVSKTGRLLQFTVSLRRFKWKDCRNPPSTKVASIIDQEQFRRNIVFVAGKNGRLYQYNKVTELWHEHYQSQHLVLSRSPGTAMRPSPLSLKGSVFMLSKDGVLLEYEWNAVEGWNWVEHGTPSTGITLVGSPGPCFERNQLFLIGSDGKVYLRYMEQTMWKWKNLGYPFMDSMAVGDQRQQDEACADGDLLSTTGKNSMNHNDLSSDCDLKVASTRPIAFSKDSVIFELRDGRLAEMQQTEGAQWVWSRTIGTPTSLCQANYWTALAT